MLFVPDEDYVRLPDHTSGTNVNAATVTTADDATDAAADGDDDDDDDVKDEDSDAGPVSPSLLFASQSQYLGHSNQVSFIIRTRGSE